MKRPLHGQVVAVTGAARGIGLAIARGLTESGARVAMSDIDDAAVAASAATLGVTCHQRLDVTDPQAFGAFLAMVESELGPLDGLVNNAGIMPAGPLLSEDDRLSRRAIEIDALGVIYGTKKALALMVPRGSGHVINIASTMGETAVPGLATYNAAKAAAVMFSDTARLEFRESGVRISTVLPGGVNTDLVAGMDASISVPLPFTGRSIPVIKHVEPEDIARAVVETLRSGESHARVYVPRAFGVVVNSQRALPRPLSEALLRALGADRKGLPTEAAHRRAYDERMKRT